jgi:hypothetical protein
MYCAVIASISIPGAIDLLNEALALDPVAISALVSNRVPCNENLANHDSIQASGHPFSVGLLGIINGLFGVDERGWGAIAAVVEADLKTVVRFERVVPLQGKK